MAEGCFGRAGTLTLDLRGQAAAVRLDGVRGADAPASLAFRLQDCLEPTDPESAVRAARALAHEALDTGRSLASTLTPEGYPAWWINAYGFYHGVGQTLPWNQAWLLGRAVQSALRRFGPERLVLLGGSRDQRDLLRELARHHGIRFRAREVPGQGPWTWARGRLAERLKLALRIANGLSARLGRREPGPCRVLCFACGALQRRPEGWGHYVLQAIQRGLEQHGVAHQTLFVWNRWHRPGFLVRTAAAGYYPMEGQYRIRELAAMAFRALGPSLPRRHPGRLPGAERYGLQGLFRRKLEHWLRWRVPETSRQVGLYLRLLSRVQPRLVVLVDEVDSQGLALLTACRIRAVPTVALQHGILHARHFGYVHDPADHQVAPPCPLPDHTLVYGPHFREILERHGHFPAGAIQVTGSPGYDAMVRASRLPRDPGFRARLGLPGQGPLIVLTTQPLADLQEREAILEATCQAMARMGQGVLVIKPHPAEQDLSRHRAALRRHGLPERLLPGTNLVELLRHAELTVAQSSTTLIEALLLGCPAITLNLTGLPEILPYAESGACLEIRDGQALAGAMASMVGDPAFRRPYEAARAPFLRRMLGDLDGAATERTMAALLALLDQACALATLPSASRR